jgi:hypothetical protein
MKAYKKGHAEWKSTRKVKQNTTHEWGSENGSLHREGKKVFHTKSYEKISFIHKPEWNLHRRVQNESLQERSFRMKATSEKVRMEAFAEEAKKAFYRENHNKIKNSTSH